MIRRIKLCVALFGVLALATIIVGLYRPFSAKPQVPANPERVQMAFAVLKSMPNWTRLKPTGVRFVADRQVTQQRAHIMQSLQVLSRFNPAELRAAEVQYCAWVEKGGDDSEEGRTFLLNRFLFDVPSRYLMDGNGLDPLRGFNVMGKNPEIGSWPFSRDKQEHLHLTGWYTGYAYVGSACPSVTEFDYFARNYSLRRRPGTF